YVALKRGELFCRLGIYPTAAAELERALALGAPDEAARQAARALARVARERSRRGFVRRLIAGRPRSAVGVAGWRCGSSSRPRPAASRWSRGRACDRFD